jgi:hypothetical protein
LDRIEATQDIFQEDRSAALEVQATTRTEVPAGMLCAIMTLSFRDWAPVTS